jgi:hypothetical protein
MEHTGVIPQVAVRSPELAELVRSEGPFVTVYLTTEADIDNAAQRSEQRWKTLRGDLAGAGASKAALDTIEALVPDAHLEGQCLAAVAGPDGVCHVEHQPEPPRRDVGRVAPLPSIVPLLEWRQVSPPHVVVLADREGADLVAVRHAAEEIRREAGGTDGPIRKVGPGGWSQRRYQQRAENTWQQNAQDVANELVRLADQVNARLVVAAGDVRALQLLTDGLPRSLAERLQVVEGGRAAGVSLDAVAEDVVRAVATAVAADTVEVLRKFREERGQGDRAADGPAATLTALAAAQVDMLLVHDDPDDERTAWFGPEPNQVGTTAAAVAGFGASQPVEGRLVDVAVRAALGTGAGVQVVPGGGGPKGGLGAILRWS